MTNNGLLYKVDEIVLNLKGDFDVHLNHHYSITYIM